MARNRYVKDYRLIETINERGRIKTSYEYIGEDYRYAAEPAVVAAARRRALALCVCAWLFYVGAMLPRSGAMRTFYVSLPFVFTALPLGMLTDLALTTFFRKEPLEHRHADQLTNRYPPVCLAAAILPVVSLAGEFIRILAGAEAGKGDVLFSLCAAAVIACAVFAFSLRKSFAVRKQ